MNRLLLGVLAVAAFAVGPAGVEYHHIDLNSKRHTDLLVPPNPLSTRDMEATLDIVRARLVFKYGPGDTVSARY